MTRDEHRAKCIVSIGAALFHSSELRTQDEVAAAALDALPTAGARVVPIEATEEMVLAVTGHECRLTTSMAREVWRRMSAVGDLTKPPEEKP